MGLINWYLGKIKNIQQLPTGQFFLFLTGKVFGAMAFGILITVYLTQCNWKMLGWVVLALSFLLTLGPWLKIMFKKN